MPVYVNDMIWWTGIVFLLICCILGIGVIAVMLRRIQMTLTRLRLVQRQEWARFQDATAMMRIMHEESMSRRVQQMREVAQRAVDNH